MHSENSVESLKLFLTIIFLSRYPFALSKSSMCTVGAPHTWPQIVAALVWLIDCFKVSWIKLTAFSFLINLNYKYMQLLLYIQLYDWNNSQSSLHRKTSKYMVSCPQRCHNLNMLQKVIPATGWKSHAAWRGIFALPLLKKTPLWMVSFCPVSKYWICLVCVQLSSIKKNVNRQFKHFVSVG